MLEKCHISGFADEIDSSMDVQLALLDKLGVKYIEFRSGDGIGVADYTNEQAVALKAKLDAAGVKVSAVGSPIGKIGIEDDFAPHMEKFKHVVELAKIFETPYIRMFSFFIPEGKNPDDYRDEVLARTAQFVEYAKEQNVILLHENEKGIYGDNAPRCLDLMKNFYGDHYKCTFDFANFVQCKQDTLEAYELLKDYITYIHIKDAQWETGKVVPAGMGDGHVKEILTKLSESGYEGFLSLEPHLADFDTFKSLENNGSALGIGSGTVAFTTAYNALKEIIG